jgi:hypothetical protein
MECKLLKNGATGTDISSSNNGGGSLVVYFFSVVTVVIAEAMLINPKVTAHYVCKIWNCSYVCHFRVCAVYRKNKLVLGLLSSVWIAHLAVLISIGVTHQSKSMVY